VHELDAGLLDGLKLRNCLRNQSNVPVKIVMGYSKILFVVVRYVFAYTSFDIWLIF